MATATESFNEEVFLGTVVEFSEAHLRLLEEKLDREEEERRLMAESMRLLQSSEFVEKISVEESEESEECEEESAAVDRSASGERETSAGARTLQQADPVARPRKDRVILSRRIWRFIFDIVLVLFVALMVINGSGVASNITTQTTTNASVNTSGTCCQASIVFMVESRDISCMRMEFDKEFPQFQRKEQYYQRKEDERTQLKKTSEEMQVAIQQETVVDTLHVFLSSVTGEVRHIAFAFINVPIVRGCALRHIRR